MELNFHQIAIIALATLLFGVLGVRYYRRRKQARLPLDGDEPYRSRTVYSYPPLLRQFMWPFFRHFIVGSWQSCLLCWAVLVMLALGGIEAAVAPLLCLLLFYGRQMYLGYKRYKFMHESGILTLLLPDGVCTAVSPADIDRPDDAEYISKRTLDDFAVCSFVPWEQVTAVHVFDDMVAVESEEEMSLFFPSGPDEMDDIRRSVAPCFKKVKAEMHLLDLDEAKHEMEEDASLALYLSPYDPDDKERPEVTSQTGGQPNMPPGVDWPLHNGQPMSFLMQVRISEGAADAKTEDELSPLGSGGMLYFFADLKTADRDDQQSYRVLLVPEEGDYAPRPFPDELTPAFRFDGFPLVFNKGLGFLDPGSYDYRYCDPAISKATYDTVVDRYLDDFPIVVGHMFGGGQWVERSSFGHVEGLEEEGCFLLLQLEGFEAEEGLHPLQLGRPQSRMFFYITKADLAQHNFSRVLVDWQ